MADWWNQVVQLVNDWWGLVVIIGGFLIWSGYNRQMAVNLAKDLILLAEKKAEQYALKCGHDKYQWVVDNGYTFLPPLVRLLVSKSAFASIVQEAFDAVFEWGEKHSRRLSRLHQ